ncbi:MAG: JAB domain-containing protein [Bacillota bacterium]|nr:JAB domain-containing protein [Bacillota bacterium]
MTTEMNKEHELEVVNVRLVRSQSLYSEERITSPTTAVNVIAEELCSYDREVFCVLNLNTQNKVINMNIVSMGTIEACQVHPREVFKTSILSNAAHIMAIHNHPSGSITPSRDDIETTKRLYDGGMLLGIPLLDHIIVGGDTGNYYSFRGSELMEEIEREFKAREEEEEYGY